MNPQPIQKEVFLNGEGDAWFERNPGFDSARMEYVDTWISGHMAGARSVLEIGCADGRRLAKLASLRPDLEQLVGVDPSATAIASGKARWPHIDLRVGSADQLPLEDQLDVVILGFFLYVCDRTLLPRIVAEVDRVLVDGGVLAIIDFDPPNPRRRMYRHRQGVWSFKMNYSAPFLAYPSYSLVEKRSCSHTSDEWTSDASERLSLHILRKSLGDGYSIEAEEQ